VRFEFTAVHVGRVPQGDDVHAVRQQETAKHDVMRDELLLDAGNVRLNRAADVRPDLQVGIRPSAPDRPLQDEE
jgi:hypothetical protein